MSPDRLSPGPGIEEGTSELPFDGSQPRLLLAAGR